MIGNIVGILLVLTTATAIAKPVVATRQEPSFLLIDGDIYCPDCDYESEVRMSRSRVNRAIELVVRDFLVGQNSNCGRGDRTNIQEHPIIEVFVPSGVRFPKGSNAKRGKVGHYTGGSGQIRFSGSGFREYGLKLKTSVGIWVECEWKELDKKWDTAYAMIRSRSGQPLGIPQIIGGMFGASVLDSTPSP